ncbi:MAG: hypothetical protein KDA27_07535 [Candidatus Eisenbacteria bacterium]|uniref:Uncharacterized protein n=1 Tax=Eiseniibacteriota bacterium TaxID=2212470 RepID=A0A956NAX7_UNCEI|nr:hypothetical protein [Candidatus Eisenbacteria bacterium]
MRRRSLTALALVLGIVLVSGSRASAGDESPVTRGERSVATRGDERVEGSSDEPTLVAIDAARRGNEVVCALETLGLPGLLAEDTMARGLPIDLIVDIELTIAGRSDDVRSRHIVRVQPDLWDGDLRLLTSEVELRFADLSALRHGLSSLGPFPCADADVLSGGSRFFLEVSLSVDPTADGGDGSPWGLFDDDETSPDRERSIGLGRLFRFFLGHGGQPTPSTLRGRSGPWTWDAIPLWTRDTGPSPLPDDAGNGDSNSSEEGDAEEGPKR